MKSYCPKIVFHTKINIKKKISDCIAIIPNFHIESLFQQQSTLKLHSTANRDHQNTISSCSDPIPTKNLNPSQFLSNLTIIHHSTYQSKHQNPRKYRFKHKSINPHPPSRTILTQIPRSKSHRFKTKQHTNQQPKSPKRVSKRSENTKIHRKGEEKREKARKNRPLEENPWKGIQSCKHASPLASRSPSPLNSLPNLYFSYFSYF